ncbi:MAG: biotin/lipoyl-binding protein [Megasphaera micronuciformis]|jgi:putative acetyl-coA carboxylase biotin carboxyl carrier protein subunit|nr:biotin/lipoyl-binding protein [Megasphaera micronuciformis]MBF1325202.1 biotin/lipoyl-binding protein [Megasphaera micronuciformis]MBF1342440.1 biotin/lipoyl-binding protein [Megasphaera micronuciformis]MBF1346628.1 biotin/lipoyl-binding protein [Megasphaera micronuciformis]MBF1356158.1 biotin/lipoyl-binding protein [Megasphaera micronuciformis]
MKKFKVTVNGKSYEVDVEELGTAAPAAPVTPAPAPVAAASPAPTPAPAASAASSATQAAPKGPIPDSAVVVKAPMPGKISAIKQENGSVTRGSVILVLEAMKMQNDIPAPQDGTLTEVRVAVGDNVKTGDVLAVIMP